MKKKTAVKHVEHKVVHKKPESKVQPKKIEVKQEKSPEEVKAFNEGYQAGTDSEADVRSREPVSEAPPPEPVNLAANLPTHTPGLERC